MVTVWSLTSQGGLRASPWLVKRFLMVGGEEVVREDKMGAGGKCSCGPGSAPPSGLTRALSLARLVGTKVLLGNKALRTSGLRGMYGQDEGCRVQIRFFCWAGGLLSSLLAKYQI